MRRAIGYAKEKGLRRVVWRCVGRKHDDAANVRRTRLPAVEMGSEMTRVVLDLRNIGGH
jgi:hypothetical protein